MHKTLCYLALSLALASAPALARETPAVAATYKDSRVGVPPPGKAQVVFFRPDDVLGMMYSHVIVEGETPVAKLNNSQYYVVLADPGLHTYKSKWMKADTLTLELDAGETYYVQDTFEMGAIGSRVNLSPSDETAFGHDTWLKPAEPPPPAKSRKRSKR